jgi:hypothetical protein
LGGTINTTKKVCARVIDNRISLAIQVLRRFRFLPHDHTEKARFITTKILPMALYGIECAEPSGHLLRQLRRAIACALGTHSARACISLVFELHNYGRDLDPHIHQFVRRAMLFRRMISKHPEYRAKVELLWRTYQDEKCLGILQADGTTGIPLTAAPPPGYPDRAQWKPRKHLQGPIALLAYSTAQIAGALDADFRVRRKQYLHVDLFNTPIQQLRVELSTCAVQARMQHVSRTRSDLSDIGDIDRDALAAALSKRDAEESRILKHCLSLSSWSNDKLFEAGQATSPACQFCGHGAQTTRHLLYECPSLAIQREEARVKFLGAGFDLGDLPKPLQLGLPPKMACTYDNTFWGTDWRDAKQPIPEIGCFNRGKDFGNRQLRDVLDRLIYANPGISAENAVSRVRGTFSSSDFPDSTWTTERAPVDPNVYTDGGVQNPASRAWATGTFGVFWPNRSLSDYPLNSVEADYAKRQAGYLAQKGQYSLD